MKILLVNGPPGCGKDTVGDFFKNIPGVLITKFAKELKNMTHRLFGKMNISHSYYEYQKNEPNRDFFGISPREAYIAVSERLMKPLFGKIVFGSIIVDEIERVKPKFVVITDCGFKHEVFPLVSVFGSENLLLIRLTRPEKSFYGDSRRHFRFPAVKLRKIDNDGSVAELRQKVKDVLAKEEGFADYAKKI